MKVGELDAEVDFGSRRRVLVHRVGRACWLRHSDPQHWQGRKRSAIKTNIEQQTGSQVSSVDCPGDVKAEKGKSFTCEATAADGTKATINVNPRGSSSAATPQYRTTEEYLHPTADDLRARMLESDGGKRA